MINQLSCFHQVIYYNYHEFSEVTNDLSSLKLKNCLFPEGDKQTFSAEGFTRVCH